MTEAKPIQAAVASAFSFAVGAALPLTTALLAPHVQLAWYVGGASLFFLGVLGFLGAWAGRARPLRPVIRVVFWGAIAMAVTAGIGQLFGAVV